MALVALAMAPGGGAKKKMFSLLAVGDARGGGDADEVVVYAVVLKGEVLVMVVAPEVE